MILKLTKKDFLIILSLCLPKFAVGFITSMVIPIFPSLIMTHFSDPTALYNVSSVANITNYHQLSILFVVKNLCQIITSPIIGWFIDILGSTTLLLGGTIFQIATILVYGLGNFYYLLIIGRIFEAISSTAINCAAAAFVAYRFKDHKQRGFVYGVNGLSLCVGTAVGPAYGGVVFQYFGKSIVFLSILVLTLIEISLSILLSFMERNDKDKHIIEVEIEPRKDYVSSMENVLPIPLTELLPTSTEVEDDDDNIIENGDAHTVVRLRSSLISAEEKIKSIKHSSGDDRSHNVLMFIKDPYFLISIGTFPVIFISVFLLFSTLPLYMSLTFNSTESQQGIIWIVNMLGYIFGFIIGNVINTKLASYRHILLTVYTVLHALGLASIPLMPVWWSIAIPLCVVVHVHLVTEVVMAPILATIVETRHNSRFGVMSGIIMMTIAITASVGSFAGPILLSKIGFLYMNVAVAIVDVLYAPFFLFLKRFCHR